jgi:hypothetical protein
VGRGRSAQNLTSNPNERTAQDATTATPRGASTPVAGSESGARVLRWYEPALVGLD